METRNNLFITYENPFTRNTGDSIYSANIIDGLLGLNEKLDIIYFNTNPTEPSLSNEDFRKFNLVKQIEFKSKSYFKFIFSLKPGMIVNRESKLYVSELKKMLIKRYDYVFINHQKMLFTLPHLLELDNIGEVIYCSHNAEYLLSKNNAINSRSLIKKIIYWIDTCKTKHFEKTWLKKVNYITAISEHDENYFKDNFKTPTHILRPVFELPKKNTSKSLNEIIIVGSFDWGPKRENLLSFLKAKNFNKISEFGFKLTIVGRAQESLVSYVNNNFKGVEMTGPVKSVDAYYKKASIAIIPEKLGGGFKLKVAEAALNKVAIFSIKGAITSCNLSKNNHFLEFETYEELIEELIISKDNRVNLNEIVQNAYNVAKVDFSFENLMNSLNSIIN